MTTKPGKERSRFDPEPMARRDFLGLAAIGATAVTFLLVAGWCNLAGAGSPWPPPCSLSSQAREGTGGASRTAGNVRRPGPGARYASLGFPTRLPA